MLWEGWGAEREGWGVPLDSEECVVRISLPCGGAGLLRRFPIGALIAFLVMGGICVAAFCSWRRSWGSWHALGYFHK